MVAYRKTLSAEEAKEHFLRRAEFVKNHSNRQRKSQNRRTQ
jgi:hypothetical protein